MSQHSVGIIREYLLKWELELTLLRSLLFYTRVNARVLAEFLFLRVQQWGRNAPGNGAGAPSTAPSVLEGWEGQTEHPGKVHCAPCE